jgi:hypothetical protein
MDEPEEILAALAGIGPLDVVGLAGSAAHRCRLAGGPDPLSFPQVSDALVWLFHCFALGECNPDGRRE